METAARCRLHAPSAITPMSSGHAPLLSRECVNTRLLSAVFALILAGCLGVGQADAQRSPGLNLRLESRWGGPVNAIEVVDGIAYVGVGTRVLAVDILDRQNPIELGAIDLGSTVQDVVAHDSGYLYALTYSGLNRFCILDIMNPQRMEVVWRVTGIFLSHPTEIDLYGSVAYIKDGSRIRGIWDISQPSSPRWVLEPDALNGVEMEVRGNLGYVIGRPSGNDEELDVYDLFADPYHPTLLGSVTIPTGASGHLTALSLEGDLAYVVLSRNNLDEVLVVIDILNPMAPAILGECYVSEPGRDSILSRANDVVASAGYAFVAEWATESGIRRMWQPSKGLAIYDVASDPTNPTLVASYKTHGTVRGVRIIDDTAFLFDDGEGLIILDIADRANPVRLSNLHSPAYLRRMDKVDNLLYVVDVWNGFTILDVSDPERPEVIGVYQTPPDRAGYANHWDITVRENLAYFSAGESGLEIVDVVDPANPTMLGAFRIDHYCGVVHWQYQALELDSTRMIAHLGNYRQNCATYLHSLDVSNPQAPRLSVELLLGPNPRGDANDIVRQGDDLLHIALDNAVQIIDWSVPKIVNSYEIINPTCLALLNRNRLFVDSEPRPHGGGIYVQDVSDPLTPINLFYYGRSDTASLDTYADRYLYVAAGFEILTFDLVNGSRLIDEARVESNYNHILADSDAPIIYLASDDESRVGGGLAIMKLADRRIRAGRPR